MLKLKLTAKYRKDHKRLFKRGYDMAKLKAVIDILLERKPLPRRYKDHALTGDFEGYRECHVLPDWLLIYAVNNDDLVLVAFRTGTHADLFEK